MSDYEEVPIRIPFKDISDFIQLRPLLRPEIGRIRREINVFESDRYALFISFHPGVDLRASTGTPVMAARDGTVLETGTLEIYGLFVIINHDGGYQSVYAHLDEILVSEGQIVDAGDRIALSGNSGVSTGPHLHFEIRRNGKPADPSRLTSFYN